MDLQHRLFYLGVNTMSGNRRGKLKEHFEGIHRNMDWSLHHINTALALIASQVKEQQQVQNLPVDDVTINALSVKHPLYMGVKVLGEGIQTLDNLAQDVYSHL